MLIKSFAVETTIAYSREMRMAVLNTCTSGGVLVAQLNREKAVNPLNRELEQSIKETCLSAQDDAAVKAIVFTGGVHRSFCAGDDLSEASELKTLADVEEFIDRIIALYVAILSVAKPTVAGIDGYAIGAGFEMALCCDWRVGTEATKVIGWELKHGLACPIAAYMIEKSLGRAAMSDIIYGCEVMPVDWGTERKFFNEIAEPEDIVERAVSRAAILGAYPEVAYRRTKESLNRSFIGGLNEVASVAKESHAEGFLSNSAQAHFARVLKR
ncbi:enoyl-CoA hydratase/isomerase family protein [Bradyrhizobium genosp. SA-3]|uniref:enoyl-CoA hydratase/isomerase family protein n=1 Tax=Bradyrhizobium genosp. SA-3 TaxID=508868 RepID=UPI001FE102EF|nr:enoyl-CoA hydratase/isomerase family protein [Bradyrhizobium genosp. SA-3]